MSGCLGSSGPASRLWPPAWTGSAPLRLMAEGGERGGAGGAGRLAAQGSPGCGERTVPPIHRRFWRTMRRVLAVLRRDPREGMLIRARRARGASWRACTRGGRGRGSRSHAGPGSEGRARSVPGAASVVQRAGSAWTVRRLLPGLPEPSRRASYKNYNPLAADRAGGWASPGREPDRAGERLCPGRGRGRLVAVDAGPRPAGCTA